MHERLERSRTERMWAGVCGGIARYFHVDPTLVRGFFAIATIFTGGLFLLVYIVLLIIMPEAPLGSSGSGSPPSNPSEPAASSATPQSYAHDAFGAERRREAAGWLLLLLGVVFLLGNVGLFRAVQWSFIWPLALIALGVYILMRRTQP